MKNNQPLPNPGIPDPYKTTQPENKQEENSTPKISEPTFLEKVVTYAKSTAKHIATGAKLRSQEEIDAIMDICRACPFFNVGEQKKETAVSGKCGKGCGCNLNTNKSHVTNKIARLDESCPDKRW